jgi:hypothetical protein
VRDGPEEALQFQVIIREDGRFTFYYKQGNTITEHILSDKNAWVVGISGTRYTSTCSSDAQCNTWLDPSGTGYGEYYCDNSNHDVTDFEPGYRCLKDIGQLCTGSGDEMNWCLDEEDWHMHDGHGGSWQGE